MNRAKEAIASFVSKDGKHTTDVHQEAAPAVTEEHVQPQRHENVTTAVDRENHQDHYRTVVQPIKHKEVLPEKHTHNAVPVEHKVHDHRDDKNISAKLEREAAKFKDSTTTHSTTHTSSTAPVVGGEHTHHHVHEHIQPVIQKETVAPEVVHTTVPIHETHHQEAIHHGTHVLPTKTMEEFSNNREIFDGRAKSKVTEFEGCPSDYNKNLREDHPHTHERGAHSHGVNSSEIGSGSVGGRTGTRSQGLSNSEIEPRAGVETGGRRGLGSDSTTEGSIAQKPSLKDRLNPFKDADGDGKKGLMD